jgi:hypothetical protein
MAPKPEPVEEDEIDLDEEDGDYDEEEIGFDLGAVLEPFLATEDGQTVCTALVTISKHLENQNKILIKILSQLSKKDSTQYIQLEKKFSVNINEQVRGSLSQSW